MKRLVLLSVLVLIVTGPGLGQSVHIAGKYNYPTLPGTPMDSVLNGLKSIRSCAVANDVDGDGEKEIAVTNYSGGGVVSVFETVGDDSIRLVWTSPHLGTGTGDSPRHVVFGDLDNDGKMEVIYQLTGVGVVIFEWDGVMGSDNYGTIPSQIIGTGFLSGLTTRYTEFWEIANVDNDPDNELVLAYDFNPTPNDNDGYYVISAVGDWSTNDPGFSSFTVEYSGSRTQLPANYGLGGGSPICMIAANLDGSGSKEIIVHNWNRKNITVMRSTGANSYALADTTNGRQNVYLGGTSDDVALFGGLAIDIDNDGRDEVYMPTYPATASPNVGVLHMISYESGESTSEIDSTNVTPLDMNAIFNGASMFGVGWGDIDGDGKREVYVSSSYGKNIVALEFQGGDKRNPANWESRIIYKGDSTIYTGIRYRDSLGVLDTLYTVDPSFVSKFYARNTDLDGDGKEDIVLPYQALSDSMTVSHLTWNGSTWDSTGSKVVNPKRWGLRVLERSSSTGIDAKDLTIILPDDYRLGQNYPNPFNPSTTISYYLPIRTKISLKVFDVLGREVRTLINNEEYAAGTREVVWDGRNNHGVSVVSGTYFYTLSFGNFSKTNKMMLVK